MQGEEGYLQLMDKILKTGASRDDRTGTGTLSLFGEKLEFDISESFPMLTTKKVFFDKALSELLFFLSGKTDTKILSDKNNRIWEGNTSEEFLRKRGLPWRERDMGPGYSFQWRHCGAEYKGCDFDYTNQGIDQISDVIRQIKEDPHSRRIIVCSWNPQYIGLMALPPCHSLFQFYVDGEYLDCQLYQRSGDIFLGNPLNIVSYSLLTYMIAKICGLKPRKFYHVFGDVHIYKNHIEQCKLQLSRTLFKPPTLLIKRTPESIFDFKEEDFEIQNYEHHPYIRAEMSV